MTGNKNSNFVVNLFKTGKVVRTKISVWSGKTKLNPEFLGLDGEDLNKDLVSLGSMWLLPKREIDKLMGIRSKANQAIASMSMKFDFGGNFVPSARMDEAREKLESMKVDFEIKTQDLKYNYESLSREMLDRWNAELLQMAAKKGDPDLVFDVMTRIESCFPSWDEIAGKFSFSWVEYDDINKIAEDFVVESTKDLVTQMAEFASRLKEKVETSGLKDINLRPVRSFLENIKSSVDVFQNEKVNEIMATLEQWSKDGVSYDVEEYQGMRDKMLSAMDGIVSAAGEGMNEIAAESVKNITNFKRKIRS